MMQTQMQMQTQTEARRVSGRLTTAMALLLLGCASASEPPAAAPAAPGTPVAAAAAPSANEASPWPGKPLPALSYPLLDGGTFTAEAARGSVLVLDVWATFCKPCVKAFPKLDHLARSVAGVVVVGISVDEDDQVVRDFLARVPVSFAIARDPALSVRDGQLAVSKIPTLMVVDRQGIVRFRRDEMTVADYDEAERQAASLAAAP